MTLPQIVSAVVLLIVFTVGTVRSVNLGALALVAGILVGPLLLDVSFEDALSGFPIDLFILILGVTYLFAIATVNGTIDWIVSRCVAVLGDRRTSLPPLLFVLAAVPTCLGALGPAAVGMLAPIALGLGSRYHVRPGTVVLMVIFGVAAGCFSPLNPAGAIVNGAMARADLPTDPVYLFVVSFAFSAVIAVIAYFLSGGRDRLDYRNEDEDDGTSPGTSVVGEVGGAEKDREMPAEGGTGSGLGIQAESRLGHAKLSAPVTPVQLLTLAAILIVAVLALVLRYDVGASALVAAVALNVFSPRSSEGAGKLIGWNVVLLICGIVTYVDILDRVGTIDAVGSSLAGIGVPTLAVIAVCAIAGLISAFASSTGILVATVPLLVPILLTSDVDAVAAVTALAICATIVDVTPFSSGSALLLSSAPEHLRGAMQSTMLRWSAAMVVVGPVATGLILVLP